MKTIKKSFATPSAKPVDVQYRLKRAIETAEECAMFLGSIVPESLPEGSIQGLLQMANDLAMAATAVSLVAPQKRGQAKKAAPTEAVEEGSYEVEERLAIQEESGVVPF